MCYSTKLCYGGNKNRNNNNNKYIPELVFTLHQPLPGAERDRLHRLWDLGADTLLLICQPREGLKTSYFI